MSEYDNTNRGALFRNERKESDSQPDYRGPINVQGVEMELAAWLKTSKNGKKFMSLSIGPKWEPKEKQAPKEEVPFDDFSDPIPFN